ncbi:MAG: hypothetical protein JSU86_07570 [Phycisphaerales bacterium]|nr:MAG: hypothetical protein JSU86_07570 [Phycisphaerales bacterium]
MLTDEQIAEFAVDLAANQDPDIVDALVNGRTGFIAKWYNQEAVPAYWVFKTSVTTDDARKAFDWEEILTGAPVDALNRWAFDTLMANGDFDPSSENNRNGLARMFTGQPNTKLNILAASTRKGSKIEKLFAQAATGPGGGDGSAQTAAAVAVFVGEVTTEDVQKAIVLIP